MNTICVFLNTAPDIETARRACADALGFEPDAPNNLDALHDALCSIARPTTIVITQGEPGIFLATWLGRLRAMMRDAERDNPHLTVVFA